MAINLSKSSSVIGESGVAEVVDLAINLSISRASSSSASVAEVVDLAINLSPHARAGLI